MSYCIYLFASLFTDLFIYLLTYLFIYLPIYLLIYLFTYLYTYFFTYLFIYSLIFLSICLLIYSFSYSLIQLFTYPFIYSFMHSFSSCLIGSRALGRAQQPPSGMQRLWRWLEPRGKEPRGLPQGNARVSSPNTFIFHKDQPVRCSSPCSVRTHM